MTDALLADLTGLVRYERDAVEHFGGHYGEEQFTTVEMVPCETGAWVKYSDLAALLSRAATPAKEPKMERRIAQRRSEANTPRSESLPQRRSWKDRRASLPVPSEGLREQLTRETFLAICTAMQKTCEHGQAQHVERCISCVVEVAVEAINQERLAATGAAAETEKPNEVAHAITVSDRTTLRPGIVSGPAPDALSELQSGVRGLRAGAAAETPAEDVLTAPMAAGLLLTLKAECEAQHARAEKAEAQLAARQGASSAPSGTDLQEPKP